MPLVLCEKPRLEWDASLRVLHLTRADGVVERIAPEALTSLFDQPVGTRLVVVKRDPAMWFQVVDA